MRGYLLIISIAISIQCYAQKAFDKIVQKYDILCLGEETHGIETYYHEKQKLIKTIDSFSNQELLILVESPFVLSVIKKLRNQPSDYHYHHTNTPSNIAFFSAYNNLGFDFQEDCRFIEFSKYLIDNDLVDVYDPDVKKMDSLLSLCIIGDNYQKDIFSSQDLKEFLNSVDNLTGKVLAKVTSQEEKYLLNLCFTNRKYLGQYLCIPTTQRYKHRIKYRDEKMAINIESFNTYYKNNKKVVWTANTHIGRKGIMGKKWTRQGIKSSIEYLSEKNILFTIAIKKKLKRTDEVLFDQTVYLSKIRPVDDKYLKSNCQ